MSVKAGNESAVVLENGVKSLVVGTRNLVMTPHIAGMMIDPGNDVTITDKEGRVSVRVVNNSSQPVGISNTVNPANIVGESMECFEFLGPTPLHRAWDSWIAGVLIRHGADVNAVDEQGRTALHCLVNTKAAKVVLEHGADVNAVDNNGHTPLYYAKNPDLIRLFTDHGGKLR